MIERLRRARLGFGVAAVLAVYAYFAVYCHQWAAMAPDESFYAVAAHDVWAGRALYGDFAYTQMPLYPYIDGALLQIVGQTLFAHRALNAVWGLITLFVVMATVRHRTRAVEPTLLAGFLLAVSPRWVSLQSLAVWCAPSGAFLALAFAAALFRGPYWRRAALFALFAALACGCRLTSAPIVAAMSLLFAFEGGIRRWLGTAAFVAAACILPVVPFLLRSPERFLFDVWGYHVSSGRPRDLRIQAGQWWNLAPAVTTCLTASLLAAPRLIRRRAKPELALLLTGVVGMIVPVLPPAAWGVYAAASIPVTAVAVAVVLSSLEEWRSPLRFAAWASLILPLFVVLAPMTEHSPSDEVADMADFIRRGAPAGPLLTAIGAVAVEAERPLVERTEMGPFAAMAQKDAALARRTGFTTIGDLERMVRRREPAAVVRMIDPPANLEWNFRWAVPTMEAQDTDAVELYENAVRDCYRSAYNTPSLELLVRKERCDDPEKE